MGLFGSSASVLVARRVDERECTFSVSSFRPSCEDTSFTSLGLSRSAQQTEGNRMLAKIDGPWTISSHTCAVLGLIRFDSKKRAENLQHVPIERSVSFTAPLRTNRALRLYRSVTHSIHVHHCLRMS
jgi:hypothetical protein